MQKLKSKRSSNVNNQAIVNAITELNKMLGFNEQNLNVESSIIFKNEEMQE